MSGRPLTILVLHAVGDWKTARRTLVEYITAFERHAPEHQYLYHDTDARVTDALRRIRFDVILLDSTFLDARCVRPLEIFEAIRDRYAFVGESDAIKVALPQDEYDNGLTLDDWLADWKTDVVFACGVHDHWDVVFPRTGRIAELRAGLTGFFDVAAATTRRARARPLRERPIDVGYRVNRLPPEFGRFGALKARVADVFDEALEGHAVKDISTDPRRMFMGDAWWDFLGRCKHTLGAESGSSLFDPRGEIRRAVRAYLEQHPGAPFDEVEAACFPGLDGRTTFRMISPRVFEATATMTSQVLVEGGYLGLLQPWEHYIPVAEDFSNLAEVREALGDLDAAARRAEACFETLATSPRVHYARFVEDVLGVARARVEARGLRGTAPNEFQRLRADHQRRRLADVALDTGVAALKRLRPLKRLVPVSWQARVLALLGRRIGLKE